MVTEVIIPMLGETMEEGTIVAWHKSEGDLVEQGEVLFTIETDKAALEVESQVKGVLRKIFVSAGHTVPVLSLAALISSSPEDDISTHKPQAQAQIIAAGISETIETDLVDSLSLESDNKRLFSSPRARKLAKEQGVKLDQLKGTGPGGRISERDVIASLEVKAIQSGGKVLDSKVSPLAQHLVTKLGVDVKDVKGTGPRGRIMRKDVERANVITTASESERNDVHPPTRIHRLMAERMTKSFTSAPHFYLHADVDARSLIALRKSLLPRYEHLNNVRITFTDLLLKFCGLALADHRKLINQWIDDGISQPAGINIGVAVDSPKGLVVPVIRNVDRLDLIAITQKRIDLSERARDGKLRLDDLEAGVFTLTNLGMYRVDYFDAILNPPQAAILAVGRIRERALVEKGRVVPAPMMTLSLTIDHRVLDGATAARFLGDLVDWIEVPGLALDRIELL